MTRKINCEALNVKMIKSGTEFLDLTQYMKLHVSDTENVSGCFIYS